MIDAARRSWRAAMADALYGEGGFYVTEGAPARHFRTAAHTSPRWAEAIVALARQVDQVLGEPTDFAVVDVGAGGGELVNAIADVAPTRWQLVGVDLAPRPDGLANRVRWQSAAPDAVVGVLIACELLDVVPLDVVARYEDGIRRIEVEPTGDESIGPAVDERDTEWLERWWPLRAVGDRAEVGRTRDAMWESLTRRLDRGLAVAIDYAADPVRDVAGTLTGFRDGRQVMPVPDGTCDLTAHVLFASLVSPGDIVVSQRDALAALGLTAAHPSYDDDPGSYLAALSAAGDAAELLDPNGLGGFTWLIHQRDVNVASRWGVGRA